MSNKATVATAFAEGAELPPPNLDSFVQLLDAVIADAETLNADDRIWSREFSIVVTKLQEAALWLGKATSK